MDTLLDKSVEDEARRVRGTFVIKKIRRSFGKPYDICCDNYKGWIVKALATINRTMKSCTRLSFVKLSLVRYEYVMTQ